MQRDFFQNNLLYTRRNCTLARQNVKPCNGILIYTYATMYYSIIPIIQHFNYLRFSLFILILCLCLTKIISIDYRASIQYKNIIEFIMNDDKILVHYSIINYFKNFIQSIDQFQFVYIRIA